MPLNSEKVKKEIRSTELFKPATSSSTVLTDIQFLYFFTSVQNILPLAFLDLPMTTKVEKWYICATLGYFVHLLSHRLPRNFIPILIPGFFFENLIGVTEPRRSLRDIRGNSSVLIGAAVKDKRFLNVTGMRCTLPIYIDPAVQSCGLGKVTLFCVCSFSDI